MSQVKGKRVAVAGITFESNSFHLVYQSSMHLNGI